MPRIIITSFVFSTLICFNAKSQSKTHEVYLNHVYIVLDSATYVKLSDSNFITKKLGDIKSSSTSTTASSWSGKYLLGRNGYFELFALQGFEGASLGDCGLGFMTKKSDDILAIEKNWRATTSDTISKDTTVRIEKGVKYPSFYSVSLLTSDTVMPFTTWVMENTAEELSKAGFSPEETKKEITWEDYRAKKNKTKFDKAFDHIKSVHLALNQHNYQYLKKSLLGFGLREKQNTFYNSDIEIIYTLTEKYPIRLESVETELNKAFPENNISLGDTLKVHVKGNRATWLFSY